MIIGSGQLGSRHLQGLMLSRHPLNIFVVDPSNDALKVAKSRAEEIKASLPKKNITYLNEIPSVDIHTCIIATSADIRAKVTQALLNNCNVKNIIFEKILFQKKNEYLQIKKELRVRGVQAWVNCPRRTDPAYKEIKYKIDKNEPVLMKISGNGWGMACNSIHFIDLFCYLIESTIYKITKNNLNKNILQSKRSGFKEVCGDLEIISGSNTLIISCINSDYTSSNVEIENKYKLFTVNETLGVKKVKDKNNITIESNYKTRYQSELSGEVIDNLIENNKCDLTSIDDSVEIHLPFINTIKKHFEISTGSVSDSCPIT